MYECATFFLEFFFPLVFDNGKIMKRIRNNEMNFFIVGWLIQRKIWHDGGQCRVSSR